MGAPPSRRDSFDLSSIEFRTSSFCAISGCVAVGKIPGGGVAVRDSKHADSPVLSFTADEWTAFVRGVKEGEFD
ncbi:MAG TPA: DUF397 domain-containing protein [Pseudonocardiaceae bacterium]